MKRYIRSSSDKLQSKAYIVTFGTDDGGPESGPIIHSGEYLLFADSPSDACRKFEAEFAKDLDGYEGCWARKATEQEIQEWESEDDGELPFASTRTNKTSINANTFEENWNDDFEDEDSIRLLLEDVAQETGAFDYNDMIGIEFNDISLEKLSKLIYRYTDAADANDEGKCERIGKKIADYLKKIKKSPIKANTFDDNWNDDEDFDETYDIQIFLEDVAQETGAFDYSDITEIEFTDEVIDQFNKFMYRYMAAADDGDESRCNRVGQQIATYLKKIK